MPTFGWLTCQAMGLQRSLCPYSSIGKKTIQRYLQERESLKALILPIDSRRAPTPLDLQMLAWCAAAALPVHVLLTKCDKLGRQKQLQSMHGAQRALADMPLVTVQLFSATQPTGISEARQRIVDLLSQPSTRLDP